MTLFETHITENSDVCANCFVTVWKSFPVNYVNVNGQVKPVRKSMQSVVSDDRYPKDIDYSQNAPFCGYCGIEYPNRNKIRPITKRVMKEYGGNLTDTLELHNVDFNEDIFWDELLDRKSNPENSKPDDDLFEIAIEIAALTTT